MSLRLINGSKTDGAHSDVEVQDLSDIGTDYSYYEEFFKATFRTFKKDIFSGELFIKENGHWQSIRSQLRVLRSHAQDTEGLIKPSRIEDHLARFSKTFSPELLIELPEHDVTKDYLKEVCRCLHPKNISQQELYELILEWGGNMWRRFENPAHQNRVLIFQSAQGIGKDFLIRSIFGGLDQFFVNFTVSHSERENHAILNQALVINISEFDRTAKINSGLLKDMITRDSTFVRLPFDRCAIKRAVRCSFVGSCNTKNILIDTTGNRRYIVVEIDKIDHEYPNDKSLEILAQFKAAAEAEYQASEATHEKMRRYIESITPREPQAEIINLFDSAVATLELQKPDSQGIFVKQEVDHVLADIEIECEVSEKKILGLLNKSGRSHRIQSGMLYGRPGIASRYRETQKTRELVTPHDVANVPKCGDVS